MTRQLRLEYPGAIYHVMNRGDLGESAVRFCKPVAKLCGDAMA